MKGLKLAAALFLLSASLTCYAYGVEMSIKFSGGFSYLTLGNINRAFDDWVRLEKLSSDYYEKWTYMGKDDISLHSGLDFNAELVFSITPHFAISAGLGFIYAEAGEEKAQIKQVFTTASGENLTFIGIQPTKVTAYPFIISSYYTLNLSQRIKLFVRGGAGFIRARYIDRFGVKEEKQEKFGYSIHQRASATGGVLTGSLGIIYEIEQGFELVIEASARQARISGFFGENLSGEAGTLYYLEAYEEDFDFWQAKHLILPEEHDDEQYRNIEEAEVDFSGFSIKMGFQIKF